MSFLSCTALLLKRVARFFFIFTNSTTYKNSTPAVPIYCRSAIHSINYSIKIYPNILIRLATTRPPPVPMT